MLFMKTTKRFTCSIFLILSCVLGLPLVAQQQESCSTVIQALKYAKQITVGMKRSEVEKMFKQEGGVSFRVETVYGYRECAMLKLRITFSETSNSNEKVDPAQDSVLKVSEMFVDWPTRD